MATGESHDPWQQPSASKHRKTEEVLNVESFGYLKKRVGQLTRQMCRLGMDSEEKYLQTERDSTPLYVYGGPFEETSRGLIMRFVMNQHIDNSYTDYRAIFVDDFLVGNGAVAHDFGLVMLDNEGNFEESPTQPPIIWEGTDDALHLFHSGHTTGMLREPGMPQQADEREQLHLQAERATTVANLLAHLKPGDFSDGSVE